MLKIRKKARGGGGWGVGGGGSMKIQKSMSAYLLGLLCGRGWGGHTLLKIIQYCTNIEFF
jgi:hypothetical protein